MIFQHFIPIETIGKGANKYNSPIISFNKIFTAKKLKNFDFLYRTFPVWRSGKFYPYIVRRQGQKPITQ